jgi:magnesium-protoporphyrin O-methyltransferase
VSCCSPAGCGAIFGARAAERDARGYRRRGLRGSARWLFEALCDGGVDGRTVLEAGGGVGALQIELLEAGAARAVNVEIVDGYEREAAALLAEHDLDGRAERRIGDFAGDEQDLPVADIVVMHRVLCCYPDADALTAAACRHARERVALTIPRRAWWVRAGLAAANAWLRVRRIAFRAYAHRPEAILRVARSHGFDVERRTRGVGIWESVVLRRPDRLGAGGDRAVRSASRPATSGTT